MVTIAIVLAGGSLWGKDSRIHRGGNGAWSIWKNW